MEPTVGTLKRSIQGGSWIFLNTIIQKVITFFSFLILARLLTPEDFGIMAIIFIVPNFLDTVTSLSFESSLIQKEEDIYRYLNTIWTFNVLKALFLFGTIALAAPLIADFFNIPHAINAIRLSGLFPLTTGLVNVAQIFFWKEIDFKKFFFRDMAAICAYAITAIILARHDHSFWPLFWGNIAQYTVATGMTYVLHAFRPKFSFQAVHLRELFPYTKWIYGQNLLNRFFYTLQNSLIAKMTSPAGLGIFNRANSLAVIPTAPFYNIINRITFPAYSMLQDSYTKIKDGFLKSLDILFFINVPIVVMFVEAGHQIVLILLGEKWITIDPLLKFLVFAVSCNSISILALPILNAVGKPKIQFRINTIQIITLGVTLAILMYFDGIRGAALAVLITSILISSLAYFELKKIIPLTLKEIVRPIYVPLAASLITLFIGRFALTQLEPVNKLEFLLLVSLLSISYAVVVILAGILFKRGPLPTLQLIWHETKLRFKKS